MGAKRMMPLFSVVPSDRTCSNGHKLKHFKFHLSTRNNFTLRMAQHLNRLPNGGVESPLGTFQIHLLWFVIPVSPTPVDRTE